MIQGLAFHEALDTLESVQNCEIDGPAAVAKTDGTKRVEGMNGAV